MILLPKCRAFNVVLEKGHGTGKKGMARRHAGDDSLHRGHPVNVTIRRTMQVSSVIQHSR